jgi:SAM-dependent methyltransferase
MQNKISLIDHYNSRSYPGTDKANGHCYIQEYYDNEFSPKQLDKLTILEIGIDTGISLDLWGEYFVNSELHGMDIRDHFTIRNENNNIYTYIMNASDPQTLTKFDDGMFDYIIDDGSHLVNDQLFVVEHWVDKLKVGGKIIIEDIQSDEITNQLCDLAEKLGRNYRVVDMRYYSNRWDDVIFEITR